MPSLKFHKILVLSILQVLIAITPSIGFASNTLPHYTSGKEIAHDLTRPLGIENAGDGSGRLFIVTQDGAILTLQNGEISQTPFLHLGERVFTSIEKGLLGVAFPPISFSGNWVYVFYCDHLERAVVSRFRITEDPNVADPTSEEIILTIDDFPGNHNGGQITFGPDGLLYISVGDAEKKLNSQRLDSLHGKILRIDVRNSSPGTPYVIPASNPHAAEPGSRGEILYSGLRNPWRFSFDSSSGDLFIADVGENRREEINIVPASSINSRINFGWPFWEGTFSTNIPYTGSAQFHAPSYEYSRPEGYCITGGFVYRGPISSLKGLYIFGDFATRNIWGIHLESGKRILLMNAEQAISTFGEDEEGNLYYAEYGGDIFQIVTPDTLPPPLISQGSTIFYNRNSIGWTIYSKVEGATIRYTLDGSEPNESSPVFPKGSTQSASPPYRIRAIAFHPHLKPSQIAESHLRVYIPDASIHLPQEDRDSFTNSYFNYPTVSMSRSIPGVNIHYTVDGTIPTTESPKYNPDSPPSIYKSCTLTAVAFSPDDGWAPSSPQSRSLVLKTALVSATPHRLDFGQPLTLSTATVGATVHYTLDGSPPTKFSPIWKNPMTIPPFSTVKLLSIKGDMDPTVTELRISQISSDNAETQIVPGFRSAARDVAISPSGELLTIAANTVVRISDGKTQRLFSNFTNFNSISFTPDLQIGTLEDIFYSITKRSVTDHSVISSYPNISHLTDFFFESDGGILATSESTHNIWRVEPNGEYNVLAGNNTSGDRNGPLKIATFNGPAGVTRRPSGEILIAERGGHRIRKIHNGNTTTYAGTGELGWRDGPIATAQFHAPSRITVDRLGNLYVTDGPMSFGASRIRKISPDGWVSTLRGREKDINGITTRVDLLEEREVTGIDCDAGGVIYYSTFQGVKKITQEDWDNDGIPDEIERQLGAPFVVGVDDRKVDSDGDSFSNAAEWIAGTSPSRANDRPARQSVLRHDGNSIHLLFPATPGSTREVEYSDDLETWYPTGPATISELPTHTASGRMPAEVPARFYRMKETR